jgi:hypothetical protein
MKVQDYKKQKILEKIEYGNLKAQHVEVEKAKLMKTRFTVRKEADKQKK